MNDRKLCGWVSGLVLGFMVGLFGVAATGCEWTPEKREAFAADVESAGHAVKDGSAVAGTVIPQVGIIGSIAGSVLIAIAAAIRGRRAVKDAETFVEAIDDLREAEPAVAEAMKRQKKLLNKTLSKGAKKIVAANTTT